MDQEPDCHDFFHSAKHIVLSDLDYTLLQQLHTSDQEAIRQYHQNISMPNYTVLLESCTQFYIQTYLEHYYTNIQQYTIDAKQLLPHAVPPQENQQVQIVPEVPPIASNHTSSWTRSTPRCSSCSCLFGFTTEGKSSTTPLSVIGLHSMSS